LDTLFVKNKTTKKLKKLKKSAVIPEPTKGSSTKLNLRETKNKKNE